MIHSRKRVEYLWTCENLLKSTTLLHNGYKSYAFPPLLAFDAKERRLKTMSYARLYKSIRVDVFCCGRILGTLRWRMCWHKPLFVVFCCRWLVAGAAERQRKVEDQCQVVVANVEAECDV